MKTRLIRFVNSFYDAGIVKFAAGQHYPIDENSDRHVAAGDAVLVEIDIDAEKAEKLALKARAASDRAAAAAAEAESLVLAAQDAEKLAADAFAALDAVQTSVLADAPGAVVDPVVETVEASVAVVDPVAAPAETPAAAE